MSFAILHKTSGITRLSKALLLYTNERGNTAFATAHDVLTPQDEPAQIGPGRPLSLDNLFATVRSLSESCRTSSGFLDERVLSIGLDFVIWWQPPTKRTHFFDCAERPGEHRVGKRTGQAPTPGLIFIAKGHSLWVYAVKGDSRPQPDTPLFHSPYMNVYADGGVCTGSMPLPAATLSDSRDAWEAAFFASNFTHPNHAKAVQYEGGLHGLSTALLDGKHRKFPQRALLPHKGQTAGSLVADFERKYGA